MHFLLICIAANKQVSQVKLLEMVPARSLLLQPHGRPGHRNRIKEMWG